MIWMVFVTAQFMNSTIQAPVSDAPRFKDQASCEDYITARFGSCEDRPPVFCQQVKYE